MSTFKDDSGTWKVEGIIRSLIQPSETYLAQREEQHKLETLTPSQNNIFNAEIELKIITMLMEVGLL